MSWPIRFDPGQSANNSILQNKAYAFPFNDAGIDLAIAKIVATGQPGVVVYAAADYTVNADHSLVSGVSHLGVLPTVSFTGSLPDADYLSKGGTRFIQAAGTTGLKWNNVDKSVNESPLAQFSVANFFVYGISFVGGKKAIDIGAIRAMGAVEATFEKLFSFDQTENFPFDYKNPQHCGFGDHYVSSANVTSGGGGRIASMLDQNALIPGNSTIFGEFYTYCKNIKVRNLVIEATNVSDTTPTPTFFSQLNQMNVSGRLQGNRYGAAVPITVSAVFTTGSTVTIADNTQFDACQVGMPIRFISTVPTNYTLGVVFFVKSRDPATNTITLVETHSDLTPLNGSAGTFTFYVSGYPSVSIQASNGCAITNSNFGMLDLEASGSICAFYVANVSNCIGVISEIMDSYPGRNDADPVQVSYRSAIVPRNAQAKFTAAGTLTLTQDQSASSGPFTIESLPGNVRVISATTAILLDNSYNGAEIRYTASGNLPVTVPNNMPNGFRVSFTCTTAGGTVTLAASSGGLIASPAGLVIGGQNCTGILQKTANKVYRLTGNFQPVPVTITAATYTVTLANGLIRCDATANAQTFTLAAANTCPGKSFSFKKIDASINTVTISGATIDGVASTSLSLQYDGVNLCSNGASYDIISRT